MHARTHGTAAGWLASSVAVALTCVICPAGWSKEDAATTATTRPSAQEKELPPPRAETKHIDKEHLARAQKLINEGIRYLLSRQLDGGGWSLAGPADPAITAMALKVLVQHPAFDTAAPAVKRGFDALLTFRQKNGGIYNPKVGQQNYTTAVALMALAAAQDPKFRSAIDDAIRYLKGLQIVPGSESPDGAKIAEGHPFVGGVSYGRHGRPDLSNLGFWMEALHEAGVSKDEAAMERAIVFVTRTQNASETNPRPWAKLGVNDKGFIYAPATASDLDRPESKEGRQGQGWRSYGSMTYTGFKSLLYAGVDKTDPRVRGAYEWIRAHWRLDSNPNMPHTRSREGLYYYYHVFAKAMRAWGEPTITDRKGKKHNWRHELIAALAQRVRKDGSWQNDMGRWYEREPVLCTCYTLLALQEALKK
jgi:squalene-hopene/tetraprenyl-beta-curcumene cyclase